MKRRSFLKALGIFPVAAVVLPALPVGAATVVRELTEQEKHEMLVAQLSSYMTLNEARHQLGLPPIEGGNLPMNPIYHR